MMPYLINCGPSCWFLSFFANDDDAIWEAMKTEGATSCLRVCGGERCEAIWVRGLGIPGE